MELLGCRVTDPVRAGLAITSHQIGRYYPADFHRPVVNTTPENGGRMSPMPEIMSIKNYRISDADYANAMQRAADEGTELSTLVRGWVSDYAAGRKRIGPTVPGTVEVSRAELTKLRALIDGILA